MHIEKRALKFAQWSLWKSRTQEILNLSLVIWITIKQRLKLLYEAESHCKLTFLLVELFLCPHRGGYVFWNSNVQSCFVIFKSVDVNDITRIIFFFFRKKLLQLVNCERWLRKFSIQISIFFWHLFIKQERCSKTTEEINAYAKKNK